MVTAAASTGAPLMFDTNRSKEAADADTASFSAQTWRKFM